MNLNKDNILSAQDSTIEAEDVKEWGGQVYLKVMSGTDRDSLEGLIYARKDDIGDNFTAEFLVRCLCDEKGNRLFINTEAPALGAKNALVLKRLFPKALKLNKWGKSDDLKKT